VEDFLTKVDDTTIKEFGYDSVEEFKAVVGYVDAHLNASPKHNIINKGLAGVKISLGISPLFMAAFNCLVHSSNCASSLAINKLSSNL
ncbi:hypothetical protein ACT4US_37640, partial [Bacillus sp. HC-Mk]